MKHFVNHLGVAHKRQRLPPGMQVTTLPERDYLVRHPLGFLGLGLGGADSPVANQIADEPSIESHTRTRVSTELPPVYTMSHVRIPFA